MSKAKLNQTLPPATESDLPDGWAISPLGRLVSPSKEKVEPAEHPDAPYLSLEHIESSTGRILGQGLGADVSSSKGVFRTGDILYGRLRPYLNKVCVPDFDGICSTDILVFPHSDYFESRYLLSFLMLPNVVEFANQNMNGVQLPRIGFEKLAELAVPLPPLAEQKRIVAKVEALLERATAIRAQLDRARSILKLFRHSVLAAACSGQLTVEWREAHSAAKQDEDQDLPTSWQRQALRDVCLRFEYGSSKKSDDSGKVPVLRMGNLQDGKIDWSDLKYSSDSTEIAKYSLAPNTVMFNRTNSPELVGKTAIYRGERPAIFAGYLIRIVHDPRLDPQFLNYCLNEQAFREYCIQVKSDGVSQSNINAQKLASYEVPLPPLAEQREIVRRVEALFGLADKIEANVRAATARAERLPQAILARAFRGELVPTEAELAAKEGRDYEPASALLARIEEARKHQKTATRGRGGKKATRQRGRGPTAKPTALDQVVP